jgi:hypothetical protein
MERRVIYCSACDRNVQMVVDDGRAAADLTGAVCLDIGETCTGTTCPVAAISPEAIRRRLAERTELAEEAN